ncbi:hypothetical protein, partial [Shigella sonnei]|uniref:hypothetical protein n=1 Tax=Shigella sonnei TaxID=624 RepID=UPI001C12FE1A
DRNRSHWSTSKTPSYTKSVSWQHHPNQRGKRGQNARVAKPILMICIELYVLRFFLILIW